MKFLSDILNGYSSRGEAREGLAYSPVFLLLCAIFAISIASLTFVEKASAEEYRISVSRKGPNLYSVIGKEILIMTKFCYEYVYAEEALLRMNGYSGSIVFLETGGVCDVNGVYSALDLDPGNYSITITHESDDWYSVMEADIYLSTFACYEYVYYESSVLQVSSNGIMRLFVGDNSYTVEKVYERIRL